MTTCTVKLKFLSKYLLETDLRYFARLKLMSLVVDVMLSVER